MIPSGFLHFLNPLVNLILDNTLFILFLKTVVAGHTASDNFIPDMNNLNLNALFFQFWLPPV